MKKAAFLLPILLCALLFSLVGCLDVQPSFDVQPSSEKQVEYLPYEIDSTGCILRFYANETNSVNIVVPATYSIDERGNLIPGAAYSVKSIGDNCFANNNLIETVSIPDTIVSIGERAFYNCANLSAVNVTENVTAIGADAFAGCPKLTAVTAGGTRGLILEENRNLGVFIIPDSITTIENDSFSNWTRLYSISIGENITRIGDNAFSHCGNLSRVSIASSLNYLGVDAFSDCERLKTLSVSGNGENAICFAQAQPLHNFVVPLSVTRIDGGFFFGWRQLEEVVVHESALLSNKVFKDNDHLTRITCGNSDILSLFYSHPSYDPVVESDTMYVVSHKPYEGSYLYKYYIPKTLKEIRLLGEVESYCFYSMASLQKVYLPSSVSSFGTGAFSGCTGLTNVYLSTDAVWNYSISYYTSSESGTVSRADMNDSARLAGLLKEHGDPSCSWRKGAN